jgi:adenosine/AMP kinase
MERVAMSERDREEETKPRAPEKKAKAKRTHVHVGPYARSYRAGLAVCPVCDAEKIVRITDREREAEKAAKESMKRVAAAR